MRGWGAEMGKDCRKKMTGTRVVSQGGTDSEGRKAIGASRHSVSMMLCQGKNSLLLWTCHVGGIHQHNWIILLCSPHSKARIRSGAFWLDRDMRATWVVQGHELSLGCDGFLRRHNGTRWHIHLFPSPAATPSATGRVFCSESVQIERGRPDKWLFQMLWEVSFHNLRIKGLTNSWK